MVFLVLALLLILGAILLRQIGKTGSLNEAELTYVKLATMPLVLAIVLPALLRLVWSDPGHKRWIQMAGACGLLVSAVQLITGVLLMTAYSPSDSTAWSSVYFIQYQMDFGWLIRGLHHFGSQAMVVLLGVHMLQVVIAGAHLPPREVNWFE